MDAEILLYLRINIVEQLQFITYFWDKIIYYCDFKIKFFKQ